MYTKVIADIQDKMSQLGFHPSMLTKEQWDNKEVVLGVIKNYYTGIYSSVTHYDDFDPDWEWTQTVDIAEKFGTILRYISERLRDDKEIVLTVLKHHHYKSEATLRYVSLRLLRDQGFILATEKYDLNEDKLKEYARQREIFDRLKSAIEKYFKLSWQLNRDTPLNNFIEFYRYAEISDDTPLELVSEKRQDNVALKHIINKVFGVTAYFSITDTVWETAVKISKALE